jgi:6,7-dimethyl-8-ribityllumazine synthase
MVKAIHIGRSVKSSPEFEALLEVLGTLGLEQESPGGPRKTGNATFVAPLAKLSLGCDGRSDLRLQAEGTDLLFEVSDPDSVYALLERRGLKFIADHHQENSRLFVVELPGGIKTAFFGTAGTAAAHEEGASGRLDATGLRFGVVVSRFNSFITERLLMGALDALRRMGARQEDIKIVRVPGSFEIPSAARTLAIGASVDAVICLGCLLRGETAHYDVIANEVVRGIGQSAQETGVPHSLGVLTCDTLEQAIDRAGLKSGNKGFEAALAAVEMAKLKEGVRQQASGARQGKASDGVSGAASANLESQRYKANT